MFSKINTSKFFNLHRDESGQTALETAIILIAFVVVASVFAFTILSAGQASTDKGEKAIYAGLQGVQSSMAVKGAVLATGTGTNLVFDLALVSGGDPIDLTAPGAGHLNKVVIGYRDGTTAGSKVDIQGWTVAFVGSQKTTDSILEPGETAEITVPVTLTAGGQFTLEVKPPTGAVLNITRNVPAVLKEVMELR